MTERYHDIKFLDRKDRMVLCSLPHGGWLLCTIYVEAMCPRCGAQPHEPCISANSGHVVLTRTMARTAASLARGEPVKKSEVAKLRERVEGSAKFYQTQIHEERRKRWQTLGLARTGNCGSAAITYVRSVRAQLEDALEALQKVEERL